MQSMAHVGLHAQGYVSQVLRGKGMRDRQRRRGASRASFNSVSMLLPAAFLSRLEAARRQQGRPRHASRSFLVASCFN